MKKMKKAFILFCMIAMGIAKAQNAGSIGINTADPDRSSVLDIVSPKSDKGLLIPRLTTSQREMISSPANGLMIYNTSVPCLQLNNGTPSNPLWECMSSTPINRLDCASVINQGVIIEGSPAVNVSSALSYKRGDGEAYSGQSISSIGVLGLTATLAPGSFSNGDGQLIYTITGTALTKGSAVFPINIGGQSCIIVREVLSNLGAIGRLDCTSVSNVGTLTQGTSASGVSFTIPYSLGDAGSYGSQSVSSTGVTGLTATLPSGNFANGSGSLVYSITGTPSTSGTASFNINIGGQSCTITFTVNSLTGAIGSLDCSSVSNVGTLTQGTSASGVSFTIPYTVGNGGSYSGQSVSSTGVTGLTATLSSGNFANGSGSLTYTIIGTPLSSGTASFNINIGGQSCTITRTVNSSAGGIGSLDCSNVANGGTLTQGTSASGVNFVIAYSSGNGGAYSGQSVSSTGVTGLTATLSSGNFANGSGYLTYTITGTPSSSGTASFSINIGGRSCTITRTVNANQTFDLLCSQQRVNGYITYYNSYVASIEIPFTGGDGTSYGEQYVQSTGVTGVTAYIGPGSFNSGPIVAVIYGQPWGTGTAYFTFNIRGKSCTVAVPVYN